MIKLRLIEGTNEEELQKKFDKVVYNKDIISLKYFVYKEKYYEPGESQPSERAIHSILLLIK